MSKKLETLRMARELLADGWTQEVNARNEIGDEVDVDESDAVFFCMDGALLHAAHEVGLPYAGQHAVRRKISTACGMNLVVWNDTEGRLHEEVLEIYDKVIKEFENAVN